MHPKLKLSALLIFKTEEGKDTERKLQLIECAKKKELMHSDKKIHGIVKYNFKMGSRSIVKVFNFQLKLYNTISSRQCNYS